MAELNMVTSVVFSDIAIKETGTITINPNDSSINKLNTKEITVKGQNLSAEALKKSCDENLPESFLRLLNNPPARKALTKKHTTTSTVNPCKK